MAFTLFDGEAAWDYAGVRLATPPQPPPPRRIRATVSPAATTEGTRVIRVSAIDQQGTPASGLVHLVHRSGETEDLGVTNTSITHDFDQGTYKLATRCPGYPEVELPFRVGPPSR